MVDISFDGQHAVFEVRGLHKVWALKSRLRIPLAHIRAVNADPATARRPPAGLRLPGTHVPGLITAGSYREFGGRWSFWDVIRSDRAIVVELTDERYAELVIEVADPAGAIAMLQHARPSAA